MTLQVSIPLALKVAAVDRHQLRSWREVPARIGIP
jgi:hypothetical protein